MNYRLTAAQSTISSVIREQCGKNTDDIERVVKQKCMDSVLTQARRRSQEVDDSQLQLSKAASFCVLVAATDAGC